jgi:hypothetical protein
MLFALSGLLFAANPKQPTTPVTVIGREHNHKASLSYIADNVQVFIELNSKTGEIDYDFATTTKTYHITALKPRDSFNYVFSAYYQDGVTSRTEAHFSAQDLASTNFDAIRSLGVDSNLVNSSVTALLGLPTSVPNFIGMKKIGLTLLDPIYKIDQQNILGIFYASCYWGCVAGGGSSDRWIACGDYCHDRWGAN